VLQQEATWKHDRRGSFSADRRVDALAPDAAHAGPLRASVHAAALGPNRTSAPSAAKAWKQPIPGMNHDFGVKENLQQREREVNFSAGGMCIIKHIELTH
jgi:hypothetical protein